MDWTTFWESINVVEFFAWVVGITVVLTFLRVNLKYITDFFLTLRQLGTLTTDIAYIRKELEHNGGHSVKDVVVSIGEKLSEHDLHLAKLGETVDGAVKLATKASSTATRTQTMLKTHIANVNNKEKE